MVLGLQIKPDGEAPAARVFHTMTVVGNKVVIFAGHDGEVCALPLHTPSDASAAAAAAA